MKTLRNLPYHEIPADLRSEPGQSLKSFGGKLNKLRLKWDNLICFAIGGGSFDYGQVICPRPGQSAKASGWQGHLDKVALFERQGGPVFPCGVVVYGRLVALLKAHHQMKGIYS